MPRIQNIVSAGKPLRSIFQLRIVQSREKNSVRKSTDLLMGVGNKKDGENYCSGHVGRYLILL